MYGKNPRINNLTKKFLVILFLCTLFQSCIMSTYSKKNVKYDFTELTALIEEINLGIFIPETSMIIIKDNEVIYDEYFGSYYPYKTIGIASSSKWLAGATIMTLVDDKLLSLDSKIGDFLPIFTDELGNITVAQCMSHTSGIEPSTIILGYPYSSLEECINDIASEVELHDTPGTVFYYGGISMQIAGRVAELAANKTWYEIFNDNIVEPLDLANTSFSHPNSSPIIAGSATSSINDYSNFLHMILNKGSYFGEQIISIESIIQMEEDYTKDATIGYSVLREFDPTNNDTYGIGMWRDVEDDESIAVELSCVGWSGIYPWIDRDRNYCAIITVNDELPQLYDSFIEVREKVNEIFDTPVTTDFPRNVTIISLSLMASILIIRLRRKKPKL